MAAGATYEPIATNTLSSAATSITFSSIPATYTDLRIVTFGKGDYGSFDVKINSDTASNYSHTILDGNGTAASTGSAANVTYMLGATASLGTYGVPTLLTWDFLSYAGSTYKTMLGSQSLDRNGAGITSRWCALWRNTAAITRIDVTLGGGTNYVGSTLTLYGIKAA